MSDKKWGFEKDYGHKTTPLAWQTSSGFCTYQPSPLELKSFRPVGMPLFRDDFLNSRHGDYGERSLDRQSCMSSYGVHRELIWASSLRMTQNPFPGRPRRQMRFMQHPSPTLQRHTPQLPTPGKAKRSSSAPQLTQASQRDHSAPPGTANSTTPSSSPSTPSLASRRSGGPWRRAGPRWYEGGREVPESEVLREALKRPNSAP